MRIVARKTLSAFWKKHGDAEVPLKSWFHEAKQASWVTPQDIKDKYNNASILADNRVVFNIKGNDYRLVVKIHYNRRVVYIRFVGTHDEYDKIDAETI